MSVMKVIIVKDVMTCDVSPVAMFDRFPFRGAVKNVKVGEAGQTLTRILDLEKSREN